MFAAFTELATGTHTESAESYITLTNLCDINLNVTFPTALTSMKDNDGCIQKTSVYQTGLHP
jgi:hypothetical protein